MSVKCSIIDQFRIARISVEEPKQSFAPRSVLAMLAQRDLCEFEKLLLKRLIVRRRYI
jgi:hypothetical protein